MDTSLWVFLSFSFLFLITLIWHPFHNPLTQGPALHITMVNQISEWKNTKKCHVFQPAKYRYVQSHFKFDLWSAHRKMFTVIMSSYETYFTKLISRSHGDNSLHKPDILIYLLTATGLTPGGIIIIIIIIIYLFI